MKPGTLALAGVAAVAGFAALAHYQAVQADAAAADAPDGTPGDGASTWSTIDLYGRAAASIEGSAMADALTAGDAAAANVAAFLDMLSTSEGTDRAADPYRVCYSYAHTIANLSEHPAVSGEWMGEPLDKLGPRYAGLVSTAAGRYQIIKPTWIKVRNALRLPDFSAESQDLAAVYLIKGRGALADVQAGSIAVAIDKCAREWASLPGSTSGQPQRRLASLLDAYGNAGGELA